MRGLHKVPLGVDVVEPPFFSRCSARVSLSWMEP